MSTPRKRARGTGGRADEIREGSVADREDLRAAWRVGVARQQEAIHPVVRKTDDAEARGNVDARKRARGTGGRADEIREGGVADREDLRAAWRVGVARQQEAIHPVVRKADDAEARGNVDARKRALRHWRAS